MTATLAERAVLYLSGGPRVPDDIAHEVLGIARARGVLAERLVAALLGADPRFAIDVEGRWCAVPEPAFGALPLADLGYAVVDVETTGMRARAGDRVTEIAVVHVDGDRVAPAFESLVNPEVPIPHFIAALTGIDDAMVEGAPRFEEVADQVLAALNGRVFVAHNARFDWAFVSAEIERAGGLSPRLQRLCTVRMVRALVPELERRNLDSVMHFFGIEAERRHRAGGDALATAAVLRRLLRRAEALGIGTWPALRALVP
ncbi:MAG TPA: 3'-5' exonuclease [Gemmatimonadales bacterium]|nr:3'-5' exonuclease [Gemmatimonadales bacterium]